MREERVESLAESNEEIGKGKRRVLAGMSGVRKAAVLHVAVGEDLAKEILRELSAADAQRLTEELADCCHQLSTLATEV